MVLRPPRRRGLSVLRLLDPAGEATSAEPVDALDGIGPAYAERLGEAGVDTVADLAAADAADLAERTGLGDGRVAGWIERARSS